MAGALPLDGVRIADFSWVLAGPHCTKWLGAMGAEVIKVESRYRPDRFRSVPPFVGDRTSLDTSVAFNMLNYSKRDCTINLGTEHGQRLARQLVDSSDVVIENFSTGVAERLGLAYDDLTRTNPKLIMVSCSGLGRTGPDAKMRAFGKSIHAFAGHTQLAGWPGTPPRGIGGTWTDPVTGVTAVLAILAGLAYARRTGGGLHIELSMAEATMALMAEPFLEYFASRVEPQPVGNRSDACVPHNTYRCADSNWVAITAHDTEEWRSLCHVVALPADLAGLATLDARLPRRAAIDAALDAWCASRNRDEVVAALTGAGVCCAPVRQFDELLTDDHFRARGLMQSLSNEGVGAYHIVKLPWQTLPAMAARYTPTPTLGQDNDYVFRSVLGLSSEQIAEFTSADVLV